MSSKPGPQRLSSFLRQPLGAGKKTAFPPGSLIHIGERRAEELAISTAVYDADSIEFKKFTELDACPSGGSSEKITWVHVSGLHDTEQIARIGEIYGVHPLALEDILNTGSHPKIEDTDDILFVVTKMLTYGGPEAGVDAQHFALLLLPGNVILTFLEGPSNVFDPVNKRLKTGGSGRIRVLGADYLAWAILDAVVDNYFNVIDGVMDALTDMEDKLQDQPAEVEAHELFTIKKEVAALHRMVRPIRDIATTLHNSDVSVLTPDSRPFLRDLYDHAVHVRESVDDLRESAAALRDFYLSIASNRMNEVMKVLTCFSTIFLPLTFFAGIYGMNFEHIPELKWYWGYPALWALFIIIATGMIFLFRRMKWL